MRDAEGIDGGHQLAAVPDVDRAAGADRVEDEDADAEGGGFEVRAVEPRDARHGRFFKFSRFFLNSALSGSMASAFSRAVMACRGLPAR